MQWLDQITESFTKIIAQNTSRRSFISTLGKTIVGGTAASVPILAGGRAAQDSSGRPSHSKNQAEPRSQNGNKNNQEANKMTTGFIYHELYMWHNTGNFAAVAPYGNPIQPYEHAENPETKRRFRNLLDVSGLLKQLAQIEPREATDVEILRYHTRDYLEKIRSLNDEYAAETGWWTPMGRGSFEIAKLAAGGVIEAVDAVLDGRIKNAYALVRPPGHHALPDKGFGFCIFGNAVIAGMHALEVRKLDRIAIVDWDVHHGNGTQEGFWQNPNALTISIHQELCFPPDSGYMSERGAGKGEGYNINIPLPPGSGVGAYDATFDRVVIPALRAYKPDLIIVPSGFDAGAWDPLGRQMMTSSGYRSITRKIMDVAGEVCDGRVVMCHEGGYNGTTVPFYGLAVMETLSGISTNTEDIFDDMLGALGGQALQHVIKYIFCIR